MANTELDKASCQSPEYGDLDLLGLSGAPSAIPSLPVFFNKTTQDACRSICPNAVIDWGGRPMTLQERATIMFIGELTKKPNWQHKVFDEVIVAKWHSEVVGEELDFSEPMFKFVITVTSSVRSRTWSNSEQCLEELRHNVKFSQSTGFVKALDADAVAYKSDALISKQLREDLKAVVAPLENVPDKEKD